MSILGELGLKCFHILGILSYFISSLRPSLNISAIFRVFLFYDILDHIIRSISQANFRFCHHLRHILWPGLGFLSFPAPPLGNFSFWSWMSLLELATGLSLAIIIVGSMIGLSWMSLIELATGLSLAIIWTLFTWHVFPRCNNKLYQFNTSLTIFCFLYYEPRSDRLWLSHS